MSETPQTEREIHLEETLASLLRTLDTLSEGREVVTLWPLYLLPSSPEQRMVKLKLTVEDWPEEDR